MLMNKFVLDLGTVTASDVGQAAFFALLASGWAMYASAMWALSARGVDIVAMPEEDRVRHAEACFRNIAQRMPVGNAYREEIERYISEALPADTFANLPSGA